MPHANPRLVDLKGLSENAIANTPVTFSKDRILSRYCDDAWDMTPYLAVKNSRSYRIRFDVKFSDGTQLIEKKHAHLLDSSKRFLYVRWRVQAPHSRQYISARTLMNNWRQLVDCGEGVVDETHLQVWKGIREQQIQVLQCEDLGISSRQRCLDHLHASEKVLSDLGESIAPYTSRLKSF